MTPLAFHLDASACSGCKACQAACKDKHGLPVDVRWRRVYEVTGGGWTREGDAWRSDVFAYNLSLSCHHCARPICVEVCPTTAMHQRADGIVAVDHERCVGCQYCSWACPYDAPQYDPARGHMTKCDFCADNLAAGKPPACVAACPMRALETRERPAESLDVHPLPAASLTQPSFVVTPHAAARRPGALGNAEEVRTPRGHDDSLSVFTLLAQFAVGATWMTGATWRYDARAMIVVTVIMLLALGSSLMHLGQPRQAWRALANVRSSWLSREVLSAALFVASLAATLATGGRALWLAQFSGLALLVSMARVYTLRTVPAWNRAATVASFAFTALLLGAVWTGAWTSARFVAASGTVGLAIGRMLVGHQEPRTAQALRVAVIGTLLLTPLVPVGWWLAAALACVGEFISRRSFYASRSPHAAWRLTPRA